MAQALEQRLADLGDVQGRNIVLLNRFPGPQLDKVEEVIVSLLPQIDLLVVLGTVGGTAAKKVAGGVPTVFETVGAPVEISGQCAMCTEHRGAVTGFRLTVGKSMRLRSMRPCRKAGWC